MRIQMHAKKRQGQTVIQHRRSWPTEKIGPAENKFIYIYMHIYKFFVLHEVNREHMFSFIVFNMNQGLHTVYIYT